MKLLIVGFISFTLGFLISKLNCNSYESRSKIIKKEKLFMANFSSLPEKGIIVNEQIAVDFAKSLFMNHFPEDMGEYVCFEVDSIQNEWIVKGKIELKKGEKGGSAFVKLNRINGAVISIYHEK